MKLGIFSWYGYERPVSERLRSLKRAGFESTMLWWTDEAGGTARARVMEEAAALGLAVENAHLPYDDANDIWSPDDEVRESFIERHLECIRECRNYGIPMIVMHVVRKYGPPELDPGGLEVMRRIVAEAEKHGIVIAAENTRRIDCLETLLEGIPSGHFGLCYDTCHGRLYEPERFFLLKKYPDRIMAFHLSDSHGSADDHLIMGRGVIDWDGFVAAFPHRSYRGCLSLEVYPETMEVREEKHLADAFQALKALRTRIEKAPAR